MRPSRPAQHFWRCIHHPSKRPLIIRTSNTSRLSSHDHLNQLRKFTTSIALLAKSRSPFKSLSREDVSRLSKSDERPFKSYSNEDIQDLARNYTPEQIRAIALAEEAIPDSDFLSKAQPRNDGFLLEDEQFDDFSRIVPLIDKRYEALYGDSADYEKYKSITDMIKKIRPPEEKEIIEQVGSALLGDSDAGEHLDTPALRYSQGKNPDPRLELLWERELEELGDGLEPFDYLELEQEVSLDWSNLNERGSKPYNFREDHMLSAWSSKIEDGSQANQPDMNIEDTESISGFEPRDPPEGLLQLLGSKDVWHSKQKAERGVAPKELESSGNTVLEIDETLMARSEGPLGPYTAGAFQEYDRQLAASGAFAKLGAQGRDNSLDGGQTEHGLPDDTFESEFGDRAPGEREELDLALKSPLPFSDSFLQAKSRNLEDAITGTYPEDAETQANEAKLSHRLVRSSIDDVEVWYQGELRRVADILSLEESLPITSDLPSKNTEDFIDEHDEEEEAEDSMNPDTVLRLKKVFDRLDPKKKPDVAPEIPSLRDCEVRWVSANAASEEAENAIPGDGDKAMAYARLSKITGTPVADLLKLRLKNLVIRYVVNQTRMGKVKSTYILSVAGNENGMVGIGEGKASEFGDALRMSHVNAIRSMKPIRRYENRTIFGEVKGKVAGTVVELGARPPGFGLRVSHLIYEIARAAGLRDLSGRTPRSRNKMNVCKAAWQALLGQPDPEEIAKARGKKLVDVRKVYYSGLA